MNDNKLMYPYFTATSKVANLLRIALGVKSNSGKCTSLSLMSIAVPGSVVLKQGTIAIGGNEIQEAIYDDRIMTWELPWGWATHGNIAVRYRSEDYCGWAGGDRTVSETSVKTGTIFIPESGRGELTFAVDAGSSDRREEVFGKKSHAGWD
jgi:hypothetical protein